MERFRCPAPNPKIRVILKSCTYENLIAIPWPPCDNGKVFDAGPGSPGQKRRFKVVREKGVVKWFNAAKGYGFIQRASGEDVFVHFSAIEMSGYRTLEEGTEVEFEVKKGPKGLQAENVGRP